MNTKYETGNVIRNASDTSVFAVPADRPTEEWAGNEVRSYLNYIRPVANLFENDRENRGLLKDIYKSLNPETTNAIVEGCAVVKNGNYYEVQHGAFVYNGELFYVYPACEAVAQQIENEYREAGHIEEARLKINYDYSTGKYSYTTVVDGANGNDFTTASALISDIINKLNNSPSNTEGLNISSPVEDHIILPIFNISSGIKYIVFDGIVKAANSIPSGSLLIATISNGTITGNTARTTINGARISSGSIQNTSVATPWVNIGNTNLSLGETKTDFDGINTINNIQLWIDESGDNSLNINNIGSSKGIKIRDNFILDTACNKAWTNVNNLSESDKLPTALAVKTYVDTQIQTASRSGTTNFQAINVSSQANFASSVSLSSGAKLTVNNDTDASRVSSAVSGTASIYTKGGIEAKKSIYSDANIVGMNNGTYSLRSLKENITPFRKSAVKLINDVKIVNYNYIADTEKNHKVGFIADDTDEIFATKNHNIMDQSNCIGVLLKAVQELSAEVKKLKEELNGIKSGSGKE